MIWLGMQRLLESKKGTLSLVVLGCSTWAVMTGKIDGTAYAAIIATVSVIYNYVVHKIDLAGGPNGGQG